MAWITNLLASFFGLKELLWRNAHESLQADLAVAGAMLKAQSLQEAEDYCRQLEQQGQRALADALRRELTRLQCQPFLQVGEVPTCATQVPSLPPQAGKLLPATPARPTARRGRPPKVAPPLPQPESPRNGQP